MAKKITQLTAATAGDVTDDDLVAVVDSGAGSTKKATRVNFLDDAIATDALKTASVTPEKLVTGTGTSWAYQDYSGSITLSGITQVSGTIDVAEYCQIGKTVFVRFEYSFNAADTMGDGSISLPVTASSDYTAARAHVGEASFHDATGNQYVGPVRLESTTSARPLATNAGSTYAYGAGLSTSVPMTWTTSDKLIMHFWYEAA